ncbi:MAG: GAF domain-containing protein, partial [Motiliproteus sp.]|nr:GAF domain-containing protein [Motiliproteus sp.]
MNRLSSLRQIILAVNQVDDLDEVLQLIVSGLCVEMKVDASSIYFLEKVSKDQVLMESRGLNEDLVGRLRIPKNEGLVGLVHINCEPVNARNLLKHPNFYSVANSGEEQFKSFLGVPLVYRAEVLGTLVVQRKNNRVFPESDVAFLTTLAAQLSAKIMLCQMQTVVTRPLASLPLPQYFITGEAGSPGVAIGTGVFLRDQASLELIPDRLVENRGDAIAQFDAAVDIVAMEYENLAQSLTLNEEEKALVDVYGMITRSEELRNSTASVIEQGNWAPGALRVAINQYAQTFELMEDEYLRERAKDIRDIGNRILSALLKEETEKLDYPHDTILIGESISPIDRKRPGITPCQIQAVASYGVATHRSRWLSGSVI